MTRTLIPAIAITMMAMSPSTHGFISTRSMRPTFTFSASTAMEQEQQRGGTRDIPYFAREIETVPQSPAVPKANKKKKTAAPKKTNPAHKSGPLSPVVLLSKDVLGEEKLNEVRAKAISMHSDVIKGFVGTSESSVGRSVLMKLFELSDKDGNGKIDEDELKRVFESLGFNWLQEKQVRGILSRADTDQDGFVSLNEWLAEAPKTLKTNLVKLAKKNGGELGLLA